MYRSISSQRRICTPARCGGLIVTTLVAISCVESERPPDIPQQAGITYGERIYLVDFSQETPDGNVCTKFGVTSTISGFSVPVDGFGTGMIDATEPHNCFIPVTPKTLLVDQVEVTNDLFQVCVDSDICSRPDPSDASAAQVCSNEDDFDRCPVVDVTLEEARRLCTFIGRRLPTMVEHIAIRQSNFVDPDNPQPSQMLPYIGGTTPPNVCADALLNSATCNATRPSPVGPSGSPRGGAANDMVMAMTSTVAPNPQIGPIFDLMGSQTEWSSDGFPANRGLAEGLPWFCIGPLPDPGAGNPPTCPEIDASTGETVPCVYGEYAPAGFPFGTYPVCITTSNAAFSGQIGALAGGGIQDELVDPRTVGVFARRIEVDPEGQTATKRSYGIRCVDDRPSADEQGQLQEFNTVEVNTLFSP
ncbi:MAG: SUMF1/EgtB/PvdO family nonheme iron enzyme [Myxococcota bacterium]